MKKICCVAVIMVVCFMSLFGCGAGYTSDVECVWCGNTPTKVIESKTMETDPHYYCKECSNTCFNCGDKANKHYTNFLGLEMFLCGNCYGQYIGE